MLIFTRFLLIVGVCYFAVLHIDAANAAPNFESKVWYVQGKMLTVANLGGEAATVAVKAFDAGGRLMPNASASLTLAPGQSGWSNPAGTPAYVLVVATQPVVVTEISQALMQPEGGGGQPWPRYNYFLPATAYPIDCASVGPQHFACSQSASIGSPFTPGTFRKPGGASPN